MAIEGLQEPLLRQYTTDPNYVVEASGRRMQYHNTNYLVAMPDWNIGLQKTGYIAEAGRCLVMQATMAGRELVMVLLDSAGKYSRIGDAERIRKWVSQQPTSTVSANNPSAPTTTGKASGMR